MEKTQKKTLINNTIMMYILSIAKLVIPLISLPYLTRVLSVDCYGGVSFVKNLITYFQIVVDFGFMFSATKDLVKILKKKDSVAHEIGNTLYAQILLSAISLVVLIILCCTLDILEGFRLFAIFSFVTVFLSIFLFEYIFKSYEQMGKIAIRFVIMKLIALILTLIFVKGDKDIFLIPIFDMFASVIAIVLVLMQLRKMGVTINFSFKRIKEAFISIKKSITYFLSNFSATAFSAFNIIIIGFLLTKTDVAHWNLTMQLITAVHALYNPIISSMYPIMIKEKSLKIVHKIILMYMPLIIMGCLIVYFFGDTIISFAFTDKYVTSSILLKVMIPVLIASFFSLIYGWPCLSTINKEKAHLFTNLIGAIVQVLGIVLLIIFGQFNLFTLSVVRCVSEIVLCLTRMAFVYKNKMLFKKGEKNKTI